jgi:hypothetical protein
MKSLLHLLITLVVTLLMIAGAIFGLGDSSVFVPPPESVAEGFVRQVVAERYSEALPYLSAALAERTTEESLKQLKKDLESRSGTIFNVQGEPGAIEENRAEASARLQVQDGEFALRFDLVRQEGVWSITEWHQS